MIIDTLGVELFKTTIAYHEVVGSYIYITNVDGFVHPLISVGKGKELSDLVQIPLMAGTVNRGSDLIGSGLLVNDWMGYCGMDCTVAEVLIIDKIFKLWADKSN